MRNKCGDRSLVYVEAPNCDLDRLKCRFEAHNFTPHSLFIFSTTLLDVTDLAAEDGLLSAPPFALFTDILDGGKEKTNVERDVSVGEKMRNLLMEQWKETKTSQIPKGSTVSNLHIHRTRSIICSCVSSNLMNLNIRFPISSVLLSTISWGLFSLLNLPLWSPESC